MLLGNKEPKGHIVCDKCGSTSAIPNYNILVLNFNELEGSPNICMACIYEAITGKRIKWIPEIEAVITKKE